MTTFIYSQNYGLPKIINFENNEQEFSREQVWQIKESSNGFLYFASSKYFLEYDRNNWRIIKKTVSNPIFSFDIDSNNFYLIGELLKKVFLIQYFLSILILIIFI